MKLAGGQSVCMGTMIRTEQTTRSPRRILQLFNWPVLGTCSHDWPVVSTKRTLFCFNMHNKKIRQHWWLHGDEPTSPPIRPHRCSSSAPHRKQCNLKHSSTLLSPGYVVADDRPARARHLLQNSVATTSYRLGKERNTCMQCHMLVVDFILNFSVNFVSY
jgi:hypothetical protein